MDFVGNLLLFPAVTAFWKSIKKWQSYHHEFGVLVFWDTVYNTDLKVILSYPPKGGCDSITLRSVEMTLLDRLHTSSYSFFMVPIAVSCIVCAIMRDIGQKSWFFTPLLYITTTPLRKNNCEYFCTPCFLHNTARLACYNMVENIA